MVDKEDVRLSREDWIQAALVMLHEKGVGGIKVVTIADRLGVTSGSFYWHFKKLQELLDAILDHWEHRLTAHIIKDAMEFDGPPEERIFRLMKQVIEEGAAEPDHAIAVWARTDDMVRAAYERTLEMRFEFAAWMFTQAGFSPEKAVPRGRLMVAYLMGESSTSLKLKANWEDILRSQFEVMIEPAS